MTAGEPGPTILLTLGMRAVPTATAATPAGPQLVILDQARRAVGYGDSEAWRERMHEIDERWIAPALQALKQNVVQQLTLYTDSGAEFTLSARALRRWWRRRRPLGHYRQSAHGE